MSRRRRSKESKRNGSERNPFKLTWVKWGVGFLLMLLVLGGVLYHSVLDYMHSDAFREKISKKVSVVIGAKGEFNDFIWSGTHAENKSFRAKSEGALELLEGEEIELDVSANLMTRKAWMLDDVRIGRGRAVIDIRKPFTQLDPLVEVDGWLESILPKTANLVNAEIANASGEVKTLGGNYKVENLQIDLQQIDGGYTAELVGGRVRLPFAMLDETRLKHGKLRYLKEKLLIDELQFEVFEVGNLEMQGEVDFGNGGEYAITGSLGGLRCSDVVNEDWKQRLSGDLQASFSLKPQANNEPQIKGAIRIENGELTALPVLDHIASFTMVRDFRKLKFSKFECDLMKYGELLQLEDIEFQCDNLMRIEGYLSIRGQALEGSFQVGLYPGTLSHIPGAEEKVFLPGKDGMSWATVKIGGTLDDVQEDLTARLITAAGERMFDLIGGKHALKLGGEVLEKLTGVQMPEVGEKARDLGTEILGEGKQVLGGNKSPVEAGSDVINRGLQGIFGSEPEPEEEDDPEERR